jgi:sterol desaturase/sphingolipid hydroxylase (fatty acid hydroxylase superfamily)
VKTSFAGKRDKRGDWKPAEPLKVAPVMVWPPRPLALWHYLFGYPGYFLPWGVFYMAIPVLTWLFLTPPLATMEHFAAGWIAFIFVRNLLLTLAIVGAWHVWLHVIRAQGTDFKYTSKWLARDNPVFLFRNQFLDNLFWTVASGVPIWTAYEAVTWWAYANGIIPYVDWAEHPVYCVLLMVLVPILRETHFYLIHRLIHWEPLYRSVHYLHHNNVDVGPVAGLSMHPVEHVLYWSGVLIHWVVPSHPIHALFHLQHAALSPAQGHAGFAAVALAEGLEVKTGDYFHYLHHKYFECNYGGDGPVNLDRLFGTFHDGSEAATERMNERFLARARQKAGAGR